MMKRLLFLFLFIAFSPLAFAADRYWCGGGSSVNWNATGPTNWCTASNGVGTDASVPGSTDAVIFDGVGVGASNSTLSASTEIVSLDMTGYTNTLTHSNSQTLTINGLLFILSSGMTYLSSSASAVIFTSTSGTTLITTNGKNIRTSTFNGAGGTFQLQDDWVGSPVVVGSNTTTLTAGTLDCNGHSFSTGILSTSNSNTRAISCAGGTVNLFGSGNVLAASTTTGLTVDFSNNGVLGINNTSAASATLQLGTVSSAFGDVVISPGGSGAVIFQGTNTYNRIVSVGTKNITFPASVTTTLTAVPIISLATIISSSAGSAATLSLSSGSVCIDRSSIKDITATGGATWYAQNSTSVSGNTGITFSACPSAAGGGGSFTFVQ